MLNSNTTVLKSTSLELVKIAKGLVFGGALLTLVACQSNRVVSTEDDSADYKSATALPPLKKPGIVAEKTVNPAPVAPIIDERAPNATVSTGIPSASVAAVKPAIESTDSIAGGQFDAQITGVSGKSRLVILSELDVAWEQLTQRLISSDITVFSRNKDAGRISIGCNDIDERDLDATKVGRWSFFNRKNANFSEYCTLQVGNRKGRTVVSVIDRTGREVDAQYGTTVLNRILQN